MSVGKKVNKEDHHAPVSNPRCPPPRSIGRARPLVPRLFWPMLTIESRQRILGTLSRIVAQQLEVPPAIREATNERN